MGNLDYVIEYLKNPIRRGVYYCKVRIDLRPFDKLVDYIVKGCEKSEVTRIKGHLKLDSAVSIMNLLNRTSFALNELQKQNGCPRKISDFLGECKSGRREETPLYEEIFGEEYSIEVIEPLILCEHLDVLSVDITSHAEDELRMCLYGDASELEPLVLELVSVKEIGVNMFLEFLRSIPKIGKNIEVANTIQQTYSSRYSFRPYPLAVRLWLLKKAKAMIPRDLHDFIDKASIYHISKEWRTSTVLSAITVESLLADLYEESYQEPSPEKATLGELNEQVKKKINFPPHIAESITKTNNARISAVHRSLRLAVSEREATNALFGAVNLTLWYHSDYKR